MIERRSFIGSVAAMCAAGPLSILRPGSLFARTPLGERLNWDCNVIDTVSHRSDERKPVVTGVDVDPAGKLMAVVGDDHYVGIYDFNEKEFVHHLDKHTDWVRSARFSPDGKVLATAGNDRKLILWNTRNFSSTLLTEQNKEAIINLAFSVDGSKVATVGFEKWLRIFDIDSGDQIKELKCSCPDNHAVAFSPDGTSIAAAGRSGVTRVWNVESGEQSAQFKVHRKRVRSLEYAGDGTLVSGSDDQTIAITDPANSAASRSLPRLASKLYAVKLIDDDVIATGGSDNRIHLWKLKDGRQIGSLQGHTGTVTSLSLDGEKLVSGSYDTQVRIWSPNRHTAGQGRTHLQTGWTNQGQ